MPLEVRCEDLPPDDSGWLDIGVENRFWPKGLSQMDGASEAAGLGVPVRSDAEAVQLWLPPGKTRLTLRNRGVSGTTARTGSARPRST